MPDDDTPGVPVVCEACGTRTRVPPEEVADAVERHNEQLHGGTEEAGVAPEFADSLADVIAEDLGLL